MLGKNVKFHIEIIINFGEQLKKIIIVLMLMVSANAYCLPVYPDEAKELNSFEFADFIQTFFPSKNHSRDTWDWFFQSDNPDFMWLTDDIKEYKHQDNAYFSKKALVRLNYLGKVSTILREKKNELAWEVTYSSEHAPKFGVTKVSLVANCFNSLSLNCHYSPYKSLEKKKIKYTKVCTETYMGTHGYKLELADNQPIYLTYTYLFGSAGEQIHFSIQLEETNLCVYSDLVKKRYGILGSSVIYHN